MATVAVPAPTRRTRALAGLALAAILLCAGLLRLRLIDLPLERDEGEYACAGQLMLHGIPPYRIAWNMKFPGTYAAYAAIMMVLGESIRAIHLGLLAVNAATTVLLYLLAKQWFARRAALAAAGTFALLSLGSGVLGMAGHATHFVAAFAVAGTFLLFRAEGARSRAGLLFGSGLLYGIAFLMKQQGVFFALFGCVWLLINHSGWRRLAIFSAGAALPPAAAGLILWQLGVFERFWFWTFRYAREYAAEDTLAQGWDYFRDAVPGVTGDNLALWALAAAGLALIWRRADHKRVALPLSLFLACSFLAVCPGLIFRDHYFIVMLPAVALLSGAAVDWGLQSPRGSAGLAIWIAAMALSLVVQSGFLFRMTPLEAVRYEYEGNPFPEAIRVGDYLRSVTRPGERIAVFGSEPEIYFYADRPPATGYLYTYGLMEKQPFALTMQREMIRQLEEARPEYVVQVKVSASWLIDDDSSTRILDWWNDYSRNYTRTGLVEMVNDRETRYWWGADAERRAPPPDQCLVVYRRNKGAGGAS